jgi:hypothetical protein
MNEPRSRVSEAAPRSSSGQARDTVAVALNVVSDASFRVLCGGVTYVLDDGQQLRFGRHPDSNDIVIGSARRGGEEDTLVSRHAGSVALIGGQLVIINSGRYEQLDVVSRDHASRVRQLAPADELRIPLGAVTIAVPGRVRRYELIVEPDVAIGSNSTERASASSMDATAPADSSDGVGSDGSASTSAPDSAGADAAPAVGDDGAARTEGPLALSAERRLDLAALCAPLLVGRPGRPAEPASYAQAAVRRGITRKALEKRIEHLVGELRRDGLLPGLEPGANVKDALCIYAVRSGSVTALDVRRLDDDG